MSVCVGLSSISFGQETDSAEVIAAPKTVLALLEDTLVRFADSIRMGVIPMEKAYYNEQFVMTLRKALAIEDAYNYPFTRLRQSIHIVEPDDKSFRVFNWVVVATEFQRKYYGAIQMKGKNLQLYPLYDKSELMETEGKALALTTNKEWYGGEIYNIVKLPISDEKNRAIYAFFTYNNNSINSKKKIWEHVVFTEDGPLFGIPIINTNQGVIGRMIMEYKKEAFVNLNYNKEERKVIFDRIASDMGDNTKRFTFVPTGTLDGFELRGGMWQYVQDAIPVMRLRDGQAPIDGVFPK